MIRIHASSLAFLAALAMTPGAQAQESGAAAPSAEQTEGQDAAGVTETQAPTPPWPAGDERGMANAIGPATWQRCTTHMSAPGTKVYELSHLRSNTMPMSPFGKAVEYEYHPTGGIPGTVHASNGEELLGGEPASQGTQMDALGHFGALAEPWNGEGEFPTDDVKYYGGFTQGEVKPDPDGPLAKLGIDKAPPIVTSAVLLDAKTQLGGGEPLEPGQAVTSDDIEAMLSAQGLEERGILPGDVVYIYTGWSDNWQDPEDEKRYYTMGPGLSYEAAQYLEDKGIVLVSLDNPFTDPVNEGQLGGGGAPPPSSAPEGIPFSVHHHNLSQAGIHNIQNANLKELAADKVWTSCTIILPLRTLGASGSPVRPIAIGAPQG